MSLFLNNPFKKPNSGGGSGGSGPTIPATVNDLGTVKFANHNEKTGLVAVQSNDPRLEREVVLSNVEPLNKNVLWVDNDDPLKIVIKVFNGSIWEEISGAGGGSLITLSDAPTSYFGKGNKFLKVKSDQSGIEFVDSRFGDLVDAPKNLSSSVGKFLGVNSSGTALEFQSPTTGITSLTGFTTNDLSETTNKKYVTDDEKTKLTQLTGIVADQTTITNSINTINGKMSSSASPANKLITNSEVQNKINALKFVNLPDTPNTLTPNSFLVVNSSGTQITQTASPEYSIKKITDGLRDEYTGVKELLFNKIKGNMLPGNIIELTPTLKSIDLTDLPQNLTHGGLLVANADLGKYEHRLIEDLTFSKENYTHEVDETDWVLNSSTNKYEYTLVHTLDSTNLIAAFYDFNNVFINLSFKVLNATSIKLFCDSNIYIKAVLNSALGASSPDYGKLPPVFTFLDDSMSRSDKTYSSSKIEEKLLDYSKKTSVYSKIESDNLYALKNNEHNHTNITTLNDFSTDVNGELTWKNKKILSSVDPFFHQIDWKNEVKTNLEMIVNVFDIYTAMGFTTIVNSELLIKNNKPTGDALTNEQNRLNLIIMDDGIEVVNTTIDPQERQKFILGMSPNVKVYIKGEFDGKFYIGAF